MDRRIGAEAVAMVDRAFEEIGQSRQVDMRVRAHVHALPDVEMRGAELVEEDDGADQDRKSTRLNSSQSCAPRKPSSACTHNQTPQHYTITHTHDNDTQH